MSRSGWYIIALFVCGACASNPAPMDNTSSESTKTTIPTKPPLPDVFNPRAPLNLANSEHIGGSTDDVPEIVLRPVVPIAGVERTELINSLKRDRTSTVLLECASKVMLKSKGFSLSGDFIRIDAPNAKLPACDDVQVRRESNEIVISFERDPKVGIEPRVPASSGSGVHHIPSVPEKSKQYAFILHADHLAFLSGATLDAVESTHWESRVNHIRHRMRFRVSGRTPMATLMWLYQMSKSNRTSRLIEAQSQGNQNWAEFEFYSAPK